MLNKYKPHALFIGAILLLVVFVVGFIVTQEQIVKGGEVTILKTRPVDPRDLLRGEHVILGYQIENSEQVKEVIQQKGLLNGDFVYLKLIEDEQGIASVDFVQVQKPKDMKGLWLKGEVERGGVVFPDISQYFVPEGAGLPIERIRSSISAEVSLKGGQVRIIRLLDENLVPIDPVDYLDQ